MNKKIDAKIHISAKKFAFLKKLGLTLYFLSTAKAALKLVAIGCINIRLFHS